VRRRRSTGIRRSMPSRNWHSLARLSSLMPQLPRSALAYLSGVISFRLRQKGTPKTPSHFGISAVADLVILLIPAIWSSSKTWCRTWWNRFIMRWVLNRRIHRNGRFPEGIGLHCSCSFLFPFLFWRSWIVCGTQAILLCFRLVCQMALDERRRNWYISIAYLVVIVITCYYWPLKGMPEAGEIRLIHFTPSFVSNFPVQVFAFTCSQNVSLSFSSVPNYILIGFPPPKKVIPYL